MSGDGESEEGVAVTGGRGGSTQGVSFEFFESFLLIYSHNTHWVNVRATLPSALNMINASSVGKLVQLVTASRLTLNHEG